MENLIKEINLLSLKRGDFLVVKASKRITQSHADKLLDAFSDTFKGSGVKIVFLDEGIDLSVVRSEDA